MELTWQDIQNSYYSDVKKHGHLEYNPKSLYAKDLVKHLSESLGLGMTDKVVEIGSGVGRFTGHLAKKVSHVTAIDASMPMVSNSVRAKNINSICGDASLGLSQLSGMNAVCGFFILHHLQDLTKVFRSARKALGEGGRIGFVEPNRLNPSFLAQVIVSPEMSFRGEMGMFRFDKNRAMRQMEEAGFVEVQWETFGLFPPQMLDRFPTTMKVQERIERIGFLKSLLPFLLISAKVKPA